MCDNLNIDIEKYKHQCKKIIQNNYIFIECDECINRYDDVNVDITNATCNCKYEILKQTICKRCCDIELEIEDIKNNIDIILNKVNIRIKNYEDCSSDLMRLLEMSCSIRKLNKILLENKINFNH